MTRPLRERPPLAFLVLVFLVAFLPAQVEPARPVSDKVAREAARDFKKAMRDREETARLAAVSRLGAFQHERIVPLLITAAAKDRSARVRQAAASRLSAQKREEAAPLLRRAFRALRRVKDPDTVATLLETYDDFRIPLPMKILVDDFEEAPKEVQKGIVQLMKWVRTKDSVEWLAQHLEEPRPEWVDDPRNPPASYWKAKQEKWRYWYDEVAKSLEHLTGQLFSTEEEVRKWVKKGGRIRELKEEKSGTTGG